MCKFKFNKPEKLGSGSVHALYFRVSHGPARNAKHTHHVDLKEKLFDLFFRLLPNVQNLRLDSFDDDLLS
jgi:hypothetical protein